MPSAKQIKRLYSIASGRGFDHDAVHRVLRERYGHTSAYDLSVRQYEELTRDMDFGRLLPDAPAPAEPDIAPIGMDGNLGCAGAIRNWLHTARTLLWSDATDADLETAVRVLDAFRLTRKSWRRISADQARRTILAWRDFTLPVWREAADRYLSGRSRFNETYFQGILRNVRKELAAQRRCAARVRCTVYGNDK